MFNRVLSTLAPNSLRKMVNGLAQLYRFAFGSAYASLQVPSHVSNIRSTRAKQLVLIHIFPITSQCDADGPDSSSQFIIPGVLFR